MVIYTEGIRHDHEIKCLRCMGNIYYILANFIQHDVHQQVKRDRDLENKKYRMYHMGC